MIKIVSNKIDTDQVLQSVHSNLSGASLLFVGTTRQFTGDKETEHLEYECYESMALKKMEELRLHAISNFELNACSIVHRIGPVNIGESSIAVAVSSAHRINAFEAGQWLVDTLKKVVPIWKRENWTDGSTEWVHPENALPDSNPN